MTEAAARLPAALLLGLIRLYRRTASPALSVAFGAGCSCRFVPSCSEYAAEAVQTHGALAGAALAVRRLARCMPFSAGGFDPCPPSLKLPASLKLRPASRRAGPPHCLRVS